MASKILIVGAGVSGLVTLKECLAKGLRPTVLEAQKHSGGQWRYTEPDSTIDEVHSSIYHGTIFNSCRDASAFSDFPYDPSRYPKYLPHKKFIQYLDEYTDFFNLRPYIRCNAKVIKSEQTVEGKWEVTFEQDGAVQVEIYDVLFACTGHLSKPVIPEFKGKQHFKGKLIHSHVYRRPGPFEGEKVAVIGIGASAVDISCEISPQTEECHVITRSGAWIIPRFVLGAPVEAFDNRLTTYLPATFGQWTQKLLLNFIQGKLPPDLRPKHNILEQIPIVRSDFLEKVTVGSVKIDRAGIDHFTETGLVLDNGTVLDVDTVIACTGYLIDYPYLPSDSYPSNVGQPIDPSTGSLGPVSVELYELVVPPKYQNLFFIGLVESPSAAMPVIEAQARWCVGILTGQVALPSTESMLATSHKQQAAISAKSSSIAVHQPRHAIYVDAIEYIDRLLAPLGANPTIGKLLKKLVTGNPFMGLGMLNSVYMDITSSGQWRLFGDGACKGLAEASIRRIGSGGKEMSSAEKVELQKLKVEWSTTGGDIRDHEEV